MTGGGERFFKNGRIGVWEVFARNGGKPGMWGWFCNRVDGKF